MKHTAKALVCIVAAAGLLMLAPAPAAASLDDADVVGSWDLTGRDKFKIKKTITDRNRDAEIALTMSSDHTCVFDIGDGGQLPCTWNLVRGRRFEVNIDHGMLEYALWGAFADLLWFEFGIPHSDVDLTLGHTRVNGRINANGAMKLKIKCRGECTATGYGARRFTVKAALKGYRD